jgi:hypothetical protein
VAARELRPPRPTAELGFRDRLRTTRRQAAQLTAGLFVTTVRDGYAIGYRWRILQATMQPYDDEHDPV